MLLSWHHENQPVLVTLEWPPLRDTRQRNYEALQDMTLGLVRPQFQLCTVQFYLQTLGEHAAWLMICIIFCCSATQTRQKKSVTMSYWSTYCGGFSGSWLTPHGTTALRFCAPTLLVLVLPPQSCLLDQPQCVWRCVSNQMHLNHCWATATVLNGLPQCTLREQSQLHGVQH